MSERMAASKQAFRDYLKSFDRKKFGAGSEKDPPTDRFSALDVRKTFQEGQDKGLSKEDSARAVLDYASAVRGKTKMGGGTERELNKLLGYLSDEPVEQEQEQNQGAPTNELAPGEYDFGDPNRPGGFAGSYFDFLGGDPSDPANYFDANLLGDDARGSRGIMRAVFDNRTIRPVPVGRDSFMNPLAPMDVPEDLTDDQRDEFLAAALAELGFIEPGVFMGGNVGMVDNEATRALDELTRGFYS